MCGVGGGEGGKPEQTAANQPVCRAKRKLGGGQTGDRGRIAGLGRQIKCLFSKTEQ